MRARDAAILALLALAGCTAQDWETTVEILDAIAAPSPTERCADLGGEMVNNRCYVPQAVADCEARGGKVLEGDCRVPIELD
ncbi:MAG TPA: hypothetical protein VLA52_14530 [Thermohalobaculum sp.]|nr:hypothetical protein [Thermohalobaculum sp.]